jgi:hypothetical protein
VLKGASQQAVSFDFERLAIEGSTFDLYDGWATDGCTNAADAQAAFGFDGASSIEFQFGIEENEGHDVEEISVLAIDFEEVDALKIMRNIDDGHSDGAGDLWRGETDAIGVVHGLEHVLGEGDDILGDLGDGGAFFPQNGVTELDDF